MLIKTDQIDGETDVKTRRPVEFTQKAIDTGRNIQNDPLEIVVDTPNDLIYKFEGAIHEVSIDQTTILKAHPIIVENSIWSQCSVVKGNMFGVVVYSGEDTKLMMSMVKNDPKRSKVDDELNFLSKLLFLIMLIGATILIIIKGFGSNWLIQYFRYVLLLCSIIPISMKVNQDISKLFYAWRITSDTDMNNTTSRNSMIAEDLGRIEYFLTDKTGTLTKNEMIMKKISLGDSLLDADNIEAMKDLARIATEGKELPLEIASAGMGSTRTRTMNEMFFRFLNSILVCHAVFPEVDKLGHRKLDSISPDELSFIDFAEAIGFTLIERNDKSVAYSTPSGKEYRFKILNVFPFTSSRKRMGLIVEFEEKIYYFLKGADSIMIPFLKMESRSKAGEDTALLSSSGLRTLVFSQIEIKKEDYDKFVEDYKEASSSLTERKKKMEQVITHLEGDMDFVGITGVFDLLQDDVKESIENLRHAGIKVWMLTGDKMETAKNISVTTGLYNPSDTLYVLKDILDKDQMKKKLNDLIQKIHPPQRAFLLIDGMSLALATRHGNLPFFLELANKLTSVCCCRCAPSQKREITKAVKSSGKRVLGIGDGGNDVGMIEEAHIGVGIAGKEGKQAALASDYSIGEFKVVVKLLLFHGRLIYKTTSEMSKFIMHRGIIIATMQFCFCVLFFLIDIPLFNGILMFGYSTLFTNLPVISIVSHPLNPFRLWTRISASK